MRLCTYIILIAATALSAAEAPPKELMSYVEQAKKLGLSDEQIRRNAASAGWNAKLVDDALAVGTGIRPASRGDAGPALPENYRIGIGDVLQVAVWREAEASVPAATVRADGKITLPLIKEVEVAGFTPAEAEQMLAQRLSRYIHNADVAVIVKEIYSRKVYLVGAVRSVGAIDLKGPLTVLQGITQAGGLTDFAKRKQIYVMRTENGKQVKHPFNYEAVIRGENMEQNIVLLPNDTVVVPQ